MKSYKVGDLVRTKYPARSVLVTDREADIKNDKPGYSGILMTGHHKGMPTWGYDEQVGAVFPGSATRRAEARTLEHAYVSRSTKKAQRASAIRKAKQAVTDPSLWLVGAGAALSLLLYWRRKNAPQPSVQGLPPYEGPPTNG